MVHFYLYVKNICMQCDEKHRSILAHKMLFRYLIEFTAEADDLDPKKEFTLRTSIVVIYHFVYLFTD